MKWKKFRSIDLEEWKERLKQTVKDGKIKKEYLVILLLVGIFLLVVPLPGGKKSQSRTGTDGTAGIDSGGDTSYTEDSYLASMESQLETLLSQMDGAGDVSVMITLKSSAEKVVEKDRKSDEEQVSEEDSAGGTRTTQSSAREEATVYGQAEGEEQSPYISKELSPEVEGVVVICPGADDAVVRKNITESVQVLFGIDTHKIRIVKGRRER